MESLAFSFGHFWSRRLISVFAFCFFRWVVFGTIFGEERYCEAFPGDYDKGKNKGGGEACSTLYLGSGIGMACWVNSTEEQGHPGRSFYLAFGAGLGLE